MFKPSTLLIAVVLSSTALWSGFVTGSMSVTDALVRFLIAVPIAAAMTVAFKTIVAGYGKRAAVSSSQTGADEAGALGLDGGQTVR